MTDGILCPPEWDINFDIVTWILHGYALASFLFIFNRDYIVQTSLDL